MSRQEYSMCLLVLPAEAGWMKRWVITMRLHLNFCIQVAHSHWDSCCSMSHKKYLTRQTVSVLTLVCITSRLPVYIACWGHIIQRQLWALLHEKNKAIQEHERGLPDIKSTCYSTCVWQQVEYKHDHISQHMHPRTYTTNQLSKIVQDTKEMMLHGQFAFSSTRHGPSRMFSADKIRTFLLDAVQEHIYLYAPYIGHTQVWWP